MSATTTRQPSATSALVIPLPSAPPPPVTMATGMMETPRSARLPLWLQLYARGKLAKIDGMASFNTTLWRFAISAAQLAVLTPAAAAEDVAAFYKGRTVEVYAGSEPGSGYDGYARIVARHIGKYIPGAPTVIVKNMPS